MSVEYLRPIQDGDWDHMFFVLEAIELSLPESFMFSHLDIQLTLFTVACDVWHQHIN